MTTDLATSATTRTVRPRFVVAAATVAVVVLAALGYHWDQAPVHGPTQLFARTTSDSVHIEVVRGDVRLERKFCPQDGTWSSSCVRRASGYAVSVALAGRGTGGMTLPQDLDPERVPAFDPSAHVVTTAGLGLAPGSADEQFIVVHALASLARVRATRPDGTIDEMAPVDGIAVLATQTGWRPLGHVEAFDALGNPLGVS